MGMKKGLRRLSALCHDAKRIMSVLFAYSFAVRFIFALRFSFLVFFFTPTLLCGDCTD